MEPTRSIFHKFLEIAGFTYAYFMVYVGRPIYRYVLFGLWILSFEWLDKTEEDRRNAVVVRKACKRMGLDYYPVLLSEPETCATCGKYVRMLVQPSVKCWPCWRFHVQETHRLILVAPGERPQLLAH